MSRHENTFSTRNTGGQMQPIRRSGELRKTINIRQKKIRCIWIVVLVTVAIGVLRRLQSQSTATHQFGVRASAHDADAGLSVQEDLLDQDEDEASTSSEQGEEAILYGLYDDQPTECSLVEDQPFRGKRSQNECVGHRGLIWKERDRNYHPFEDMFAPPPSEPKSLVFITAGRSGMDNVDFLISSWGFAEFDYVLLHFDESSSEWNRFDWYKRVVSIAAQEQMKLWFYKRFGSPWLVKGYRYVHFVDSDAGSPPDHHFDLFAYESILREHDIFIAQPAVLRGGRSSDHKISRVRKGNLFRWTNFVENGPVFSVSQRAYRCFWEMINPDLVTGWGVDLGWCQYATQACGYPERKSCAIVDAHYIVHLDLKVASSRVYHNLSFEEHGRREMEVYLERLKELGIQRLQKYNVYSIVLEAGAEDGDDNDDDGDDDDNGLVR